MAAFRQRTGKPVVAYVRGRALSGGMYAMAGADRIVADHVWTALRPLLTRAGATR